MNNKGRGEMAQSSQSKGKESMSLELLGGNSSENQEERRQ